MQPPPSQSQSAGDDYDCETDEQMPDPQDGTAADPTGTQPEATASDASASATPATGDADVVPLADGTPSDSDKALMPPPSVPSKSQLK